MRWLRQTIAVMLINLQTIPASGILRRCHYRNCRRRDCVCVGAVDFRRIFLAR